MLDPAIIAAAFGLVAVAELPDKTAVAGLVLGTRYPWHWVFTGIGAAFLTHVAVAVAAGQLIGLMPRRALEFVVAGLFVLGAFLIWREGRGEDGPDAVRVGVAEPQEQPATAGFWKVASIGYGVIFVAEWGDLTQILTANLAARYHNPWSVGVGATLGLWAVGLAAILGGKTLLKVLPIKSITRIAAVIMLGLGIYSLVEAIRG